MKKITIIAIVAILIVLAAVLIYRYYNVTDAEWMMGRHYTEIVERYGDFDNPEFVDGKFDTLPTKAYYVVKPEKVGPFGTAPEERVIMDLDENGIVWTYRYVIIGDTVPSTKDYMEWIH